MYNDLLNPEKRNKLLLPLTFVTFAYIHAKMYSYRHNVISVRNHDVVRTWGNDIVYGGLYVLDNYEFYIRALDAYHSCSLSRIFSNHINDVQHREETRATPIVFSKFNDFVTLKYSEKDTIMCYTYFGNIQHEYIISRIKAKNSYRITDGVSLDDFYKQYKTMGGTND